MKKYIIIVLVIVVFCINLFLLSMPKTENISEVSKEIDSSIIDRVDNIERIIIRDFNTNGIIIESEEDIYLNVLKAFINSASLKSGPYDYVFPTYVIEIYDDEVIDIIDVYTSLEEIRFHEYNSDKRYSVDSDYLNKLLQYINFEY